MSLPPEKVNELKQVIHAHLNQLDIHGQIKNIVDESMKHNMLNESENEREMNMLQILKEKGVVNDILGTLKFKGIKEKQKSSKDVMMEKEGQWIPDEEKKCNDNFILLKNYFFSVIKLENDKWNIRLDHL